MTFTAQEFTKYCDRVQRALSVYAPGKVSAFTPDRDKALLMFQRGLTAIEAARSFAREGLEDEDLKAMLEHQKASGKEAVEAVMGR